MKTLPRHPATLLYLYYSGTRREHETELNNWLKRTAHNGYIVLSFGSTFLYFYPEVVYLYLARLVTPLLFPDRLFQVLGSWSGKG
jgi:hypothetical protein